MGTNHRSYDPTQGHAYPNGQNERPCLFRALPTKEFPGQKT